ncbi:MAG: hypothetical protein ACE5FH_00415 [Candidatus Zixiibacteriota bacterium]
MTLDQAVSSPPAGSLAESVETGKTDSSPFEARVLQIVRDDPFSSIREIRNALRFRSESEAVGWFTVFDTLRKMGLLTKRSRFRMIRS